MKPSAIVLLLLVGNDLGFRFTYFEKRNPRSLQGTTITGQVVDARTMQPLRGAIVSAARIPTGNPGAAPNIGFRTGQDGRFVLQDVTPGIVHFYVTKTGYASGPFSSIRPAAAGQQIDNVVLTVPPAASIGGQVVDESGQPAIGALVIARGAAPSDTTAGNRGYTPLGIIRGPSVKIDDNGHYWMGGLDAGEYTISVRPYGDEIIGAAGESAIVSATARGRELGLEALPIGSRLATVKLGVGESLADVNLVIQFPRVVGRPGRAPGKPGTGSIAGRVVDSFGRGVANARVLISQDGKGFGSASTDTDGAFRFIDVPVGSFIIRAARPSALFAESPESSTTAADLGTGSSVENVLLTLRPGGTISGAITDEFGDPVSANVVVMNASRQTYGEIATTAARLGVDGFIPGRGTPANARGQYRVTGLAPGDYLIGLSTGDTAGNTEVHFRDYGGNDRLLARTTVFYPSVTTASQASRISVLEDGETSNVDFVLRPMPLAQITVTVSASRPADETQLYLILLDDRLSIIERWTKVAGSTVTLNARPGRYRLLASAEVTSSVDNVTRLWASTDLEADPMVPATANMVLEPGVNVSGRVVFESANPLRQDAGPSLMPLESFAGIRIESIDGTSTFTVRTGEFLIEGVLPGRYVIQAGGAERSEKSPWMLKAATLGGRDVLDVPVEFSPGEEVTDVRLTVTDRISELTGKVAGVSDTQIGDQSVVVFSADQRHWRAGSRRTRVVRPDAKGLYTVRALPPGAYIVTLLANPISQEELLSRLPALAGTGVRVTIGDGERKVQDLVSRRR